MRTERNITLLTHLTPEVCRVRVSLAADHDEIVNWPDFKGCLPFLYLMKGERLRLRCRRIGGNSFAPYFYGRFLPAPEGTTIEGRFKMHLFTRIVITAWFSGLIGFAVFAVGLAIIRHEGLIQASGMILGAVLIASFGYGLVRFGQWFARNEERSMVTFLTQALEAEAIGTAN